jgi:hypothetical protein
VSETKPTPISQGSSGALLLSIVLLGVLLFTWQLAT